MITRDDKVHCSSMNQNADTPIIIHTKLYKYVREIKKIIIKGLTGAMVMVDLNRRPKRPFV